MSRIKDESAIARQNARLIEIEVYIGHTESSTQSSRQEQLSDRVPVGRACITGEVQIAVLRCSYHTDTA